MVTVGYFLSGEVDAGSDLVRGAAQAEQAGFRAAWISDHFHPWLADQGSSPFVWSVLGATAPATSTLGHDRRHRPEHPHSSAVGDLHRLTGVLVPDGRPSTRSTFSHMGPDQEGMITFYEREILPNL